MAGNNLGAGTCHKNAHQRSAPVQNNGRRNGIANSKSSGQNIPRITDRPRRNNYHPWHDSELALNLIR
ncbi:hypothetical protein GX48_01820 [Paracoccidioides brasiliensis]|nr:hypothetical protein GX48_01820 [Paracoccidioides brasiliensis]